MTPVADYLPQSVATPRIAAGVLFVDETDRVLMLQTTYKEPWEIPGGYANPGESPHAACIRELSEELGLEQPVGRLLTIDWAPHPDEGDKMLFIFDGGQLTDNQVAELDFADGEIASAHFIEAEDLETVTVARLARRIREALSARQSGRTAYLENGVAP